LGEKDAKGLEVITSQNIAKQILVVVNQTPLVAPVVEQPLKDGEMLITLRDKKKAEEAMSIIKKLVK
jgi:hypothetical protein